jgi:hypothetical protein
MHTVGDIGVTATLQLDGPEAATVQTLIDSRSGLLVSITGLYTAVGSDTQPESRQVELRGVIGLGTYPEEVRKHVVLDLPDWVNVASLVPPDVGPDLGIERVTIDVALGDRRGELESPRQSVTWTPERGWCNEAGPVTSLAFPLAGLPVGLKAVPRDELRFHSRLRIVAHGEEVVRQSHSQPVSHGANFLIAAALPVRVAEFRGDLLDWAGVYPEGSLRRVEIVLRSGERRLCATMRLRRHNREYGLPAPVRFVLPDAAPAWRAEVEFVLTDGTRVPWAEDLTPPSSTNLVLSRREAEKK